MFRKPYKFSQVFYRWLLTDLPTTAAIDVTSRCNLQCSHCYWWKQDHLPELKEEAMIALMRKQREDGIVCSILYGGEPTLRPDVCRAACDIFNTTMIFTNGTTGFTDLNCLWLLSMDGPEKIHDQIRGQGVYAQAMASIEKYRTPPIIHMTISKANKDHIEEFIKDMQHRPIMGIGFSFYTPNRGCDESELFIPLIERDKILDELVRYRAKYGRIIGINKPMADLFRTDGGFNEWNSYQKCDVKTRCRCFNADGTPKPCTYGAQADCARCGCAAIAIFRTSVGNVHFDSLRYMLKMTWIALGD